MSAIRDHPFCDIDDDDGMPPLVDNPNPPMTYTFFTDMTPITALSADPTIAFDPVWESSAPITDIACESESLDIQTSFYGGPERTSHSKKRDASYIPRPPNAFILFRSSFIRSQQVPEKVEGNHSTLSKIIGKYWKTLPREEREVWEAKALVAQAEHRKRYPDWRFRPGANALAKLKVKDGPSPNRRRHSQSGRKTRPRGESNANKKSKDERCAIIADLLVEGKTGVDLEDAVKKWEDKNKGEVVSAGGESEANTGRCEHKEDTVEGGRTHARSQTPDAVDTRFKIPLTAMFKRSLSAPASQSPPEHRYQHHSPPSHGEQTRQDSLGSVFANVTYDTYDTPVASYNDAGGGGGGGGDGMGHLHPDHATPLDSIGDLSPLVLPSLLEGAPARWNNPYNLLETSLGAPPPSPPLVGTQDSPYVHGHGQSSPVALEPLFAGAGLDDVHSFVPWSYTPMKHWAETSEPYPQMPIFVNEFGGSDVYEWGNGDTGSVRGGYGEPGMYGATIAPDPCSPVDYAHTHHTHSHTTDGSYDAVAELELFRVCPGYAPASVKY